MKILLNMDEQLYQISFTLGVILKHKPPPPQATDSLSINSCCWCGVKVIYRWNVNDYITFTSSHQQIFIEFQFSPIYFYPFIIAGGLL